MGGQRVPWPPGILYRGGYDLGRFYSLEEFYTTGFAGYYDAW